jgi:hypothetical protein
VNRRLDDSSLPQLETTGRYRLPDFDVSIEPPTAEESDLLQAIPLMATQVPVGRSDSIGPEIIYVSDTKQRWNAVRWSDLRIVTDVVAFSGNRFVLVEFGSGSTSIDPSIRAQISALKAFYWMSDLNELSTYLLNNLALVGVLEAAPLEIRKVFGPVVLGLELMIEPEEGWRRLYLVIRSQLSPEEIVRRETALLEGWFLSVWPVVHGTLSLAAESV